MDLAKHTPGTALSPAELRQRRDAARSRWALAGGAGLAGAVVGGAVGALHRYRQVPRETAAALAATHQRVAAESARRAEAIGRAINARGKVRPGGTVAFVVGNADNKRIYDYELDQLRRRLKGASPAAAPALNRQIRALETLKAKAPLNTARRSTVRIKPPTKAQLRRVEVLRGQLERAYEQRDVQAARTLLPLFQQAEEATFRPPVEVRAARERKHRKGGDINKALENRIANAKQALRNRHKQMIAHLERRTAHIHLVTQEQTLARIEAGLRGRILAAGGKGALIGAAIGLSAASLAFLAHHALHTKGHGQTLAKATRKPPEDTLAGNLAQTYRDWINRLLGRSETPIAFGDDLARALAGGLTQAFADGATQPPVARDDGRPTHQIEVDFDKLNPSVRRHMAEYALDRIVEISQAQRDAIREALMQQSVLQGIGPLDVARTIRQSIGLTAYQSGVVQAYRYELMQLDPAALGRKLRDKRFDPTVKRAIETNTPLDEKQIDAMVDAYHRRMLALRAQTIARTEAIRATSYGAVARAQDVLDHHPELDVEKVWIATKDARTRDTHRALDGKVVRGMLTPFITIHDNKLKWPVDADAVADEVINCRCSIGFRFLPKAQALQPEAV